MAKKTEPAPDRREIAKTKVREALAAQPHRGYPAFEDLLAVADAIIDAIDEGAVVAEPAPPPEEPPAA